jgi:hypothetical protein
MHEWEVSEMGQPAPLQTPLFLSTDSSFFVPALLVVDAQGGNQDKMAIR